MSNNQANMPGKAYSMKELKGIVDYLVQHNKYGETKARRMWMDYASSGLTNRSWQSLKETFLKRILPNIHNPYYKLTMDEIRSFRTGVDITNKPNKKSLFEVLNEEPESKDEIVNAQPSTSIKSIESIHLSGEDKNSSKVSSSRESVETFIIATDECYMTTEQLMNELESGDEKRNGPKETSFNDVVKNIVEDFQSDTDPVEAEAQTNVPQSQSILDEFEPCLTTENITVFVESDKEKSDVGTVISKMVETQKNSEKPTQNTSLPDSLLPNNPEELHKTQETVSNQIPEKAKTNEKGVEVKIKKHKNGILNGSEKKEVKKKQKRLLLNAFDEVASKRCKSSSPVHSSEMSNENLIENAKKDAKSDATDSEGKKHVKDSTTNTKIVKHVRIARQDEAHPNTLELSNPCLQSVSLFEEKLKAIETDTSESDKFVSNKSGSCIKIKDTKYKKLFMQQSEVVVLKSHSETDTDLELQPTASPTKLKKTKSLNNLFENMRGGRRGKPYPIAAGNRQQTVDYSLSDSTEWTSESDCDYVSPPRSRRHGRKLLKPSSSRILSMDKDGGLFVACGKKVYPIVKDGRMLKQFLKYMPESDTDDNDSYWKVKYVEEKKKTAELQRMLQTLNEEGVDKIDSGPNSPILPSKTAVKDKGKTNGLDHNQNKNPENIKGDEIVLSRATGERDEEKTVKIKFAKNNEEVFLEGHWQSLHPILSEVMQMFQREAGFKIPNEVDKSQPIELHSGKSTPTIKEDYDEETRRKVDEIENRIFKEIEEIDRSGHVSDPTSSGYMVSKRKRLRPRKEYPSPPKPSSPKRQMTSKDASVAEDDEIIVNENKLTPIDAEVETGGVTRRAARKPQKENVTQTKTVEEEDDDSSILYRFPSPQPTRKWSLKHLGKKTRSAQTSKKTYNVKVPRIYSSDSVALQSESSQGYQDSDISPLKYTTRRRKRLSTSSYPGKIRYTRKTQKFFEWEDASDESSNSSFNIRTKSITIQNSSLNTEEYRSESYQLLVPKHRSFRPLRRITESPCPNEVNSPYDIDLSPVSQYIGNSESRTNSSNNNLEIGNSSNVSLPVSPELSVVENISISKNELLSSGNHPTINETQSNHAMHEDCDEKYLISKLDVTMPLMSQKCVVESTQKRDVISKVPIERRLNSDASEVTSAEDATTSQCTLDGIETDNLQEKTIPESLEVKLRNMLLESAKKIGSENKTTELEFKLDGSADTKPKKRCSTPRKKKQSKNKQQEVIEECMEFCSSGRKSCPPVIATLNSAKLPKTKSNFSDTDAATTKKNVRKPKKDVIKVKIVKPKTKVKAKSAKSSPKSKKKTDNQASLLTDSGINDTVSSAILHNLNDDVNLIHNHSETCLQAHDCLSHSCELIENSNTIITLSSQSSQYRRNKENVKISQNVYLRRLSMTPDMFCMNARDATSLSGDVSKSSYDELNNMEVNSLITEDLSDGPIVRSELKDWYLFSEEEYTNTNTLCNTVSPAECTMKPGHGSNLSKLFPIACAVPDLSTITEMSRETDSNTNSKNALNTRSDLLKY